MYMYKLFRTIYMQLCHLLPQNIIIENRTKEIFLCYILQYCVTHFIFTFIQEAEHVRSNVVR